MKTILYSLAIICFWGAINSASSNNVPTNFETIGQEYISKSTDISVIDKYNKRVTINVTADTHLLIMGTWCDFSTYLKDFLETNENAQRHIASKRMRVIMLFELDEGESVYRKVISEGLTPDEARDFANENGPVYDPHFFNGLTIEYYFIDRSTGLKYDGIPAIDSPISSSALHGRQLSFSGNHIDWMVDYFPQGIAEKYLAGLGLPKEAYAMLKLGLL